MALTFSSNGCRTAAQELDTAKTKLSNILNDDLTGIMGNVKKAYQSEGAEDIYKAFEQVKAKFPEFIKSVEDCSKYLKETVGPAYEKLEQKISSSAR